MKRAWGGWVLSEILGGGGQGCLAHFPKPFAKKIPTSRLECKNHTLIETEMAKIDLKTIPFGAAHSYIAHIREYLRK